MAGLSQGGGVGLALAELDDRRRPRRLRHGYLGDGRRPLRRLGDARLHERQGPGELPAPVPDHVPERGAARRAAAADDADLRPADRGERGVGRDVRPRARAVVPGGRARAEGGRHVPALERLGSAWPRRSRAVRERVGMTEISNYAKYRVTGPGAEAWLSSLLTARMPEPGRITLTAMLNDAGPDRRRVHGRAGVRGRRVLPVRVAAGRGPPLALVPPPPAGGRLRPLRGARAGAGRAVGRRAAIARRPRSASRRTSTCRPRRSRS